MSWITPKTWAVGDPGTAADLNTYIRDNSNFLAGATGAAVYTSQTTASTAYTNLTTVGPAVTLLTGANAIVIETANISDGGGIALMGYAISGATTAAAADATALQAPSGSGLQCSQMSIQPGLTPGSNTFTAKYRVTAGTGTYSNRNILVIPLP